MGLFICLTIILTACSSSSASEFGDIQISSTPIRMLTGLAGLILLLAGFMVYEFAVQLVGFLIGGIAGALLLPQFAGDGQSILWMIIGFLGGGVIGVILAQGLAGIIIFLAGGVAGAILVIQIWQSIFDMVPNIIITIIGLVIGGFLSVLLFKLWMTALLAALGAFFLGSAIQAPVAWWVVFFIVGLIWQYGLARMTGRMNLYSGKR